MSTLYPNAVEYVTINGNYSWSNANYAYKIVPDGTTNAVNTTSKLYYSVWISNNWNSPISDNSIYVDTTTNVWYDGSTSGSPHTITQTNTGSNDTVSLLQNGTTVFQFLLPDISTYSSGPTVTSITDDTIFVPSDTVSNTDFTLLKNGSAYANTNISLTGPGAQPPSDARGYTYSLTYDGTADYTATIDSKSYGEFFYDDSWTSDVSDAASNRQTTSNRILNVLSTIPQTATIKSGSNSVTSVFSNNGRVLTHTYTADLSSISLSANTTIEIIFFVEQRLINNEQEIVGVFYEKRSADGLINYWQSSPVYIIGNQATMTRTQYLMGVTTTFSVTDWVYEEEPEGDGYVPVPTTSNGGGKPDRYPLIMTNLFNRNRSLYSIGMTHKDRNLFL